LGINVIHSFLSKFYIVRLLRCSPQLQALGHRQLFQFILTGCLPY